MSFIEKTMVTAPTFAHTANFKSYATFDDTRSDVGRVVSRSRCKRALDFCRELPLLVIFTCACNAIGNGFTYAVSYLIIPVSTACSPSWSRSATVYGASAVSVGFIVGSIMGSFVVRKHVRLYYVMSIIAYSLALGFGGLMVLSCHQTSLAGEMLYIATFGLYGIASMLVFFANFEFAMFSMPNWPGFCGGIHGMSSTLSALLFPQLIILLRESFSSSHINAGTIFFCLAILKIISSAPWMPLVPADYEHKPPIINDDIQAVENHAKEKVFGNRKIWLILIGTFAAFTPPYAFLAVQEPLLRALWNDNETPIQLLTALLMTSFLIGRAFCLVCSDKVGMKRVWTAALLSQMVFLFCLGLVMRQRQDALMKYIGMTALSLCYVTFGAFRSTMAGLGHEIFGTQYRLLALGAIAVMTGVAGLVGPMAIDTIYKHFNSYIWFLFGTAGLSLIGGVAMLPVQPEKET